MLHYTDDPTHIYLPPLGANHTLILGDTGTGKTVLAQYLAEQSARTGCRVAVVDTCQGWLTFDPAGLRVEHVLHNERTDFTPQGDVTVIHVDTPHPTCEMPLRQFFADHRGFQIVVWDSLPQVQPAALSPRTRHVYVSQVALPVLQRCRLDHLYAFRTRRAYEQHFVAAFALHPVNLSVLAGLPTGYALTCGTDHTVTIRHLWRPM